MAAIRKVNTATLIRGELYTFRHPDSTPEKPKDSIRFTYGEPVVIEEKHILEMLEDMHDETTDGDGEIFEKPTFRVDRGVADPRDDAKKRGPTRLKSDRKVKSRPLRRK